MRVLASGNLTVELIRAQRFDVDPRLDAFADQPNHTCSDKAEEQEVYGRRIDRVELSPQALACDPWATPAERSAHAVATALFDNSDAIPDEPLLEPRRISPVAGSQALAGLGAAWVVPGTLLDVVA